MAANIATINGQVQFISAMVKAWWDRLGTHLSTLGRLLTFDEAMKMSGLSEWHVVERLLYTMTESTNPETPENDNMVQIYTQIPNAKAICRSDNGHVFTTVSDRYEIIQNAEALRLAESFIGEGGYTIETLGAIGNGEKVFATLKDPYGTYDIKGNEHQSFLSMATSHDGTLNLKIALSNLRVVCQNTLNMWLAAIISSLTMRHTTNVKRKMEDVQAQIVVARKHASSMKEMLEYLATKRMSTKMMESFFNEVLQITGQKEEEISTQKKNNRNLLFEILEDNRNQITGSARFTGYDALNVISYYTDHEATVKGKDKEYSRAISSVFGTGQKMKERALQILNDGTYTEIETVSSPNGLLDAAINKAMSA